VNNWKVILATMVIFGTGVVTGGLLVNFSNHPKPHSAAQRVALPALPGVMRIEFLKRVERDLDLRAEQREHIDKILAASQERTRHLIQPIIPSLRTEYETTKKEIRDALDAGQAARFDELLKLQQRPREQRRAPSTRDPSERGSKTNRNALSSPTNDS
jgi:hypothetical protein